MDVPPSSPPMASSGGTKAVFQDSPLFDAFHQFESNDSHEGDESFAEPELPPHKDGRLTPSKRDSTCTSVSSDSDSDVDSTDSPSSPPPTEDQIEDEPYQLFLNRHRVGQNIRRINRILARYPNGCTKRPRRQLADGWKALIQEAEIVFKLNTFCLTCFWGPAKDHINNTHPQTPAMLQMISDLKRDMQATDPMTLTQHTLDAFKLRWWNCEAKYLEDNVGNACDGLPVFPRRDFSPRAGEKDNEYASESDQEMYAAQYNS